MFLLEILRLWAFPYGSGFTLQSFAKSKRISAAIPNAKKRCSFLTILLDPPSQRTGTACSVLQSHKPTLSTSPVVLPPFFSVILFVWFFSNAYSTLQSSFHFVPLRLQRAVPTHKNQTKRQSLQPPPPFLYARKKLAEAK